MKLFIVLSATLLSTAALNPLFAAPSASPNQAKAPVVLLIKKQTLDVNGKTTDVFRIEQPDGTWGYRGVKGQMFEAVVKNQTDKPTVLHWHGLVVPNNQDGVPYVTQKPILPGGEYHYRFKLKQSGTIHIMTYKFNNFYQPL
ncbi:multicopper oxidase domain-containing protein [Legionella gresilensis]|uniref:multicopper oxidase domain-containing protein n=1 Tax=Legionella gresilensis TaxID=91823 RepID=UPI001F5FB283|nr:multicopper oxidase domain-containing protein [Legionella gresilensis]